MTDAVLSVRGLCKKFGAVVACENVTFDLCAGEIHALIGPNGAGKTTLIKQISGALKQDSGKIYIEQNEISNLNVAERVHAGLARSFQISSVFPDFTVLENVMLAVQGQSRKSFQFFKPATQDQDLTEATAAFLAGTDLQSRADIAVSDLSHGERRRLELIMSAALKPKVFLLDEPMAGMGEAGAKTLVKTLTTLKTQTPILLIEHDMDVVFSVADRISVLLYGRILKTGTVDEIRSDPDVRAAYLGDDG